MSWSASSLSIIRCQRCGEYVKPAELVEFVEEEKLMGGAWAPNAWAVTVRYEHLRCLGVTYVPEVRSWLPDASDE